MSSNMTVDRFATLADAFGGDIRRWPDAERAAAWNFLKVEPDLAEPLLRSARRIDAALDQAPSFVPSAALRDLVLASAPRAAVRTAGGGHPLRWLAPTGFAAACAAGALFGLIASHGVQTQKADTVLVASADISAEDPGGL
jgi:hypothetical protein